MSDMYCETAAEALKKWDAGEGVFTAEMGGLGPGYEQAIHVLVFEILRDSVGAKLPDPDSPQAEREAFAENTLARLYADPDLDLGWSGAQVGAAKSLAYSYLRHGPRHCLALLKVKDGDRIIQVSKKFPGGRA